ncbi:MAG: beta-ketoacyl synthase N-terminal-like domain-containing protein [Sulfuricellaceae bacterium]
MTEIKNDRLSDLSPLQKAALAMKELRAKLDAAEGAQREPIAIVGMGCRFPQADGLEAYWRLLSEGRDAIGEVPAERWDLDRFYDPNPNAPGKINSRHGGFLDNVDSFDAAFFGISPREAERMDPQQRLLLEVAWHALEDAGLSPAALRGSRTGVFVGITQMDYGVMQLGGALEDIQAYTGTGNGLCFAAGRLAYVLGLHGPTFSVDTACSSSMVALHQACQALRNRECDMALVAGTQINLTPQMQIFLAKTQSFAPDGRCRTFDEAANGFVLGEGVGVLVLRRLSDAQARRDPIRAVVRASGINHDGPASGLTVPSEAAQEALLRWVYERARLNPGDIDYVEAHGTATELGDPIEVGALRAVFGERAPEQPALLLGSVKTNFGHLNAAAGIAGLIKVVLMLEHGQVAPNLHFKQASSKAPWAGFSVRVPTTLQPWPQQHRPRRAGVSSFGLAGTNTHAVVEQAPAAVDVSPELAQERQRPLHLLAISARNDTALRELASAYLDCLSDATSLADFCFSANTGRSHFAWRAALCAGSIEALRERLAAVARADSAITQLPKGGAGRLALLFAADAPVHEVVALAQTQPQVAATLARCEAAYAASGAQTALFAQGQNSQDSRAATFACQYALAQMWVAWGMRPSAVAGCGVGELTARCMAGVFDLEQAFRLLAGHAVEGRTPEISVYSGQDGALLPLIPSPAYRLPASLAANVSAAVRTLVEAGFKTLLGIGAAPMSPAGGESGAIIGLPQSPGSLWPMLLETLSQLYLRGYTVDWDAYDAGYGRQRVRLPGYPFQRRRFWLESAKSAVAPEIAAAPAPAVAAPPACSLPPAAPSAAVEASAPTGVPDLSRLLERQIDAASAAINDVVAQQLAFLKNRVARGVVAPPPAIPAAEALVAPDVAKVAEDPPEAAPARHALGDWHLLMMAADDEAAVEQIGDTLAANPTQMEGVVGEGLVRRMLVHRGSDDAAAALGKGGAARDAKRVIAATAWSERSVVFMFPGVGDHYLRMAQGLYASEPLFRAKVDWCCEQLKPTLGVDLREVLYPPQPAAAATPAPAKKMDMRAMLGRGAAAPDPLEARLNQTLHSQPLVFIIEYALGQLWLAKGVRPHAMIGYSIGEYAAACLSGVINVEDALLLIARRAQLIQALPQGVMLALPLTEQQVLPLLGENLSLAIVSTPNLCVVGGAEDAISALETRLRNDEVVSRRLPGTHAFHTRMLAPLHDALVDLVQGFTLSAPRIPYVSNLTGNWISTAEATDPVYWARHTWQTVRFADGLGRLLDTEGRVFLEVGPGQSLGSFVLQHPAAQKLRDKIVLPSLRNRYEQQPDEAFFLTTQGKLWLAGYRF